MPHRAKIDPQPALRRFRHQTAQGERGLRHPGVQPDRVPIPDLAPAPTPELNPVENVWQYQRANKPAYIVCENYDEICCAAWNFFANEPAAMTSITSSDWEAVNVQGRWYQTSTPSAVTFVLPRR